MLSSVKSIDEFNDYIDIFDYLIYQGHSLSEAYDYIVEKFGEEELFKYLKLEDKYCFS